MTAICPAGPPKLKAATRAQTRTASPRGTFAAGSSNAVEPPFRPAGSREQAWGKAGPRLILGKIAMSRVALGRAGQA